MSELLFPQFLVHGMLWPEVVLMTGQTIQADQATTELLRAWLAQAAGAPLRVLLSDGETVSVRLQEIDPDTQIETARLKQLILDGINSGEPEEMTEETWRDLEAEVVRRAAERRKAATK